jgi:REP element-mobilizing transposase RayT
MPNRPRVEKPGWIYHVTANVLDGMSLFRDDEDRSRFFDMFEAEVAASNWTVLGYTLMTTHYHVLLLLNDRTLSSGFQKLHSSYARRYNRRHARRGVVWQKRFHDEPVLSDRHLFETIRYIARNASRVDLAESPEDWPWCSYGAAIGVAAPDPIVDEDALLGLFSNDRDRARQFLRELVEEHDPRVRWRRRRVRVELERERNEHDPRVRRARVEDAS